MGGKVCLLDRDVRIRLICKSEYKYVYICLKYLICEKRCNDIIFYGILF